MTGMRSDTVFTLVTGAPAFTASRVGAIGDTTFTSQSLAADADDIARELRAAGLSVDEPVVLFVSNAPVDLAGFLGIWAAGGVAVPIHVDTPKPSVEALIDRLAARYAVRGLLLQTIGEAAVPDRPILRGAALIVFTSGSTGQPKGVVLGHAGLSWKLQALSRLVRMDHSDTVIVPLQLTFIFGIWVSMLTLMSGAHLQLAPKLSATGFGEHKGDISILATVPTLLRALCARDLIALPRLGMILTGGEPCGAELVNDIAARVPNAKIYDLFGLTETGSCDFCALHHGSSDMHGTIGRETEAVTFRIQQLSDLDLPDNVGELQIKSPAIMLGYLDDPAQTKAAFSDGYFRTGDLVSRRENGLVQLVGRSKDIVSRGGNKISPLEIENLFTQHEGVASALAFGVPDERLGERLHLMVVAHDPGISQEDLRDWSADRLERFKTPDVIHFVPTLPVGRTGKADRAAARAAIKT